MFVRAPSERRTTPEFNATVSLTSHKDGFQAFEQWKKEWNSNSQHEGNLKMFMAERILPYWVKCCDCGKWRQYPLTEGDLSTDIVESWTCRSYRKLKKVKRSCLFGTACELLYCIVL